MEGQRGEENKPKWKICRNRVIKFLDLKILIREANNYFITICYSNNKIQEDQTIKKWVVILYCLLHEHQV
jgi:hypothetical protein